MSDTREHDLNGRPESAIEDLNSKPVSTNKNVPKIGFPFLTPLCSMIGMGAVFYIQYFPIQFPYFHFFLDLHSTIYVLIGLLILLTALLDWRNFQERKKGLTERWRILQEEVDYAWSSRKQLQKRSHMAFDHADKLKRFISDKLIEQIEYDEKYLHFQNVAAEVRHNGVISYDIVRSALEQMAVEDNRRQPSQEMLSKTHRFGVPNNPNGGARQALDAMKYLWDLLDLATTDNIALHIGNQLIDSEELYFQSELDRSKNTMVPLYSPAYALTKAVAPLISSHCLDGLVEKVEKLGQTEEVTLDNQFHLSISPTENLLGNENHFLLLIENLIKNAQFFSGKVRFKQETDRIALTLNQSASQVCLSVYNRGPHIHESDQPQIFRLGYSTRRVKEHHGRGLGLYFVGEIVKGYQGSISVKNIENATDVYSIRFHLQSGEIETHVVETQFDEDRPKVADVATDSAHKYFKWSFSSQVLNVEVTSAKTQKTQSFTDLEDVSVSEHIDAVAEFSPQWRMKIQQTRKSASAVFYPMDIKGVLFQVRFNSAESRLRGDEEPLNFEG